MADQVFFRSSLLAKHGITGIFSTRCGGISPAPFDSLNLGTDVGDNGSHVQRNLRLLMRASGLQEVPHQARQVHGIKVLPCRGQGLVHDDEADILISNARGTALAVGTADCLPILLADPEIRGIAAVHAGWRGTVKQAAIAGVAAMQQMGAEPARILASLGPCIGPCCFEIDTHTAQRLAASCPGAAEHIHGHERPHADLAAINQAQLLLAGLSPRHIERIEDCTCCQPQRYFSYRRDGANSGRHLAIVACPFSP